MIVPLLQILGFVAVAIYFNHWRSGVRRRNLQSWDSLLARLRPDWSARELSDHFLWKEGLSATPEETWERIKGVRGLWAMYQNSGVMLEMADYAAQHSDAVDRELIATLHGDALQIRICALKAIAQYAWSQAGEGVR